MKKKILNLIMILCILVAVGCAGYLFYYYYTSAQSEKAVDGLKDLIVREQAEDPSDASAEEKAPEMVKVHGTSVQKKFEKLYRENTDFVGWLTIEGTNVDYPVMYTPKDAEQGEYYIHRNYEGEYSAAGLPFIDANCMIQPATDNIILYGHNMNSGKMFHDILQYEKQEFYETHKTIRFDTIYEDGEYEVVAAFRAQILPESSDAFKYYEFVNAGSEEEFNAYIDNIMKMSAIDTGVKVTYGDHLITLSTCAYHVTDGRFAVIARKIR